MTQFNWKGFDTPVAHAAGLLNSQNDCYINSVLQFIFHTPHMARFNRYQQKYGTCKNKNCGCIVCILNSYFIKINQKIKAFETVEMRNLFYALSPQQIPNSQEDAHEFLMFVLNELRSPSRIENGQKLWKQDHSEITGVEVVFGAKLINYLHCMKCFHLHSNKEKICEFNLALDRNFQSPKLSDYISAYFRTGLLSDYKCPKCKEKGHSHGKLVLDVQPKILIIQLMRFKNSLRKICTKIDIPIDLNLDNYAIKYKGAKPADYKLYGFISHAGRTTNNGHYTTTILGYDSNWYLFDDQLVTPVDDVMAQLRYDDPYILFYYKVNVDLTQRERLENEMTTRIRIQRAILRESKLLSSHDNSL